MSYVSRMFSLGLICVITYGCNPVTVPLKGKYSDDVTEITSTKSIDSVWANVNYIFTKKGVPIKQIDRKTGTIRTKKTPSNSFYTFEDTNGQLQQPQAWVVLPKDFIKEKEWKPKTIYGQWSIQITETEGKTTLKIDPIVICTYFPNSFTKVETRGQSTGKLEEMLESYLRQD